MTMNDETNTTTAEAPVAKKATKAKSKGKKAAAPSKNGEMHPHKISVLKYLRKSPETIEWLTGKTKLSRRSVYHAIFHLRKDGYLKEGVRDSEVHGLGQPYELTAKGRKAAVQA